MSKLSRKVNQLSPDGYSRFYLLTDLINRVHAGRKTPLNILDVGGGSEYMQQQLDTMGIPYNLTVIDILPKPSHMKARYIQGDATNMPFEDATFDVVISTDVLEHVPSQGKKKFVEECIRVSMDLFILAAPFDTPGVTEAEVAVNNFNIKLFGAPQNWLEEHLRLGKPNLEQVRSVFESQHIYYIDFGTQNLTTWLLNTHLNLIDAKLGLDSGQHLKLNKFYNENFFSMNEFVGPTYRHFFVAAKKRSTQKKFDGTIYANHTPDPEVNAQYISKLFDLLTNRISHIGLLESQIYDARERLQAAEEESSQLKEIIAVQAAELSEAAPLLRLAKTRPYRKLRSIKQAGKIRGKH